MNSLKIIFMVPLLFFGFQAKAANAEGRSPVAKIQDPASGSKFKIGEKITFKGKATDLEDGRLSGKNLIWTSDLDGSIGQGNSFSCTLSEGSHIVILTATDSERCQGRGSIFITVGVFKITEPVEIPKIREPKVEKPEVKKQAIPSLEFLSVPPFGSFENLKGRVLNADPNDFAIAVYIMVDGLWWTKPSSQKSATKVTNDGTWTCDITTQRGDELSIKIVAYLIPADYKAPLASGDFRLPQGLEENCLAKTEVTRKITPGKKLPERAKEKTKKPLPEKPKIDKEVPKEEQVVREPIDIADTSKKKLSELRAQLAQTDRQEKELKALLSQLTDQEEKFGKLAESFKKKEQRMKEILLDKAEFLDKELVEEMVEYQAELYRLQKGAKQEKEETASEKQNVMNLMEEVSQIRKKVLQKLKALGEEVGQKTEWKGIREILLNVYLGRTDILPVPLEIEDFGGVYKPIFSLSGPNNARIELSQRGWEITRELYCQNYMVQKKDGSGRLIPPANLLDKTQFKKLYETYSKGGTIQMVGFPKGMEVSPRNVKELIVGQTIEESYLVEYLGIQEKKPEGFGEWRDFYKGKAISKLYKLDFLTGEEGKQIGWIVDVLRKRIVYPGEDPEYFILKKFILDNPDEKIPEYLVVRPSGAIVEGDKRFIYNGEVVNNSGLPKKEGLFIRFKGGITISGLNTTRIR